MSLLVRIISIASKSGSSALRMLICQSPPVDTIILSNYSNLQSTLESEPLELSLQGAKGNGEGGDLKMKSGVLKRG